MIQQSYWMIFSILKRYSDLYGHRAYRVAGLGTDSGVLKISDRRELIGQLCWRFRGDLFRIVLFSDLRGISAKF